MVPVGIKVFLVLSFDKIDICISANQGQINNCRPAPLEKTKEIPTGILLRLLVKLLYSNKQNNKVEYIYSN